MSEKNVSPVGKISDLPVIDISDFILGADKRIIFGPNEPDSRVWGDYVVRVFTLQPGSVAPPNSHPWMHWAVCLQGEGRMMIDNVEYEFNQGAFMHTKPNIEHTFWNTSKTDTFTIMCIVPPEGDINPLGQPVGC